MTKNSPCIYSITNTINNKIYIGSAVNIRRRFNEHLSLLRRNKHHSPHLQAAWNRYGEVSFNLAIIEAVSRDKMIEREQFWINHFKSCDKKYGYNVLPKAGSWLGMKHSPETVEKMSAISKAWWGAHKISDVTRKLLSVASSRKRPESWAKKSRGESNPNAKLTAENVVVIKSRLAKGDKVSPLAKEYGVSYQQIWAIKKGRMWK